MNVPLFVSLSRKYAFIHHHYKNSEKTQEFKSAGQGRFLNTRGPGVDEIVNGSASLVN